MNNGSEKEGGEIWLVHVQQPLEASPLRLIARKARPEKAGIHVGLGVLLNEICYNSPAKYKLLANRSAYWPMGRGSWPTGWTWWIGQPTGQQVGLGQLCYSSINNKLTWPIHQVPSTKKIKLVLFIKNDIIIACYKKKCHLYSFVLWIVDKLSPSLFLLPQMPPSSYPLCTIKQLSGLLFLEPISKGRLNQESRKCLTE